MLWFLLGYISIGIIWAVTDFKFLIDQVIVVLSGDAERPPITTYVLFGIIAVLYVITTWPFILRNILVQNRCFNQKKYCTEELMIEDFDEDTKISPD